MSVPGYCVNLGCSADATRGMGDTDRAEQREVAGFRAQPVR